MTTRLISLTTTLLAILLFTASAGAHCELPCGIYDDEARLDEMAEDIVTIEKSVMEIKELQQEKEINYNQLVRWIDNKEAHANALQETVSQYFLTQRIKFDDAKYNEKLAALHQMLVYAMKCKQTVDPKMVENLRQAHQRFSELYLNKK
jgi:nickel superoxide dismutase